MVEENERGKLYPHADGSYKIEFAPADKSVHGSGSWR
jgi:hypothetical protein